MRIEKYKNSEILLFKSSNRVLENPKAEVENELFEEENPEGAIFCKLCFNKITTNSEKIIIDGNFSDEFVNPADIKFMIGYFTNAPGCAIQGIPTDEATWFPGYTWSFVMCKKCSEHLGWYFENISNGFFGLILTKLEGDL